MFELVLVALPAIIVVTAAIVLVRREHEDQVIDLTAWDDVATVPIDDPTANRPCRPAVIDGELIEPCESSLGARMRLASPAPGPGRGRVRIRRREEPLVAARSET